MRPLYKCNLFPPKHKKLTEQFLRSSVLHGLNVFVTNNLLHPKTGRLYTEPHPYPHDIWKSCLQEQEMSTIVVLRQREPSAFKLLYFQANRHHSIFDQLDKALSLPHPRHKKKRNPPIHPTALHHLTKLYTHRHKHPA